MGKLPQHIKNKIEQYMRYSHKANKLRQEIDQWFSSKNIDTIDATSTGYENDLRGVIIQNLIVDAGQGDVTYEEDIQRVISLIEREL